MNAATSYTVPQGPGLAKTYNLDRCVSCARRTTRAELERHQGECLSCSTERETATMQLDTND